MPQGICAYITSFYVINCTFNIEVQANDRFHAAARVCEKKKNFGFTEMCSMMCVCVCVSTTKYRKIVLEQGLREIIVWKSNREGGWG